jgi:uncharacterized protein (DUF2132 family)
VGAGAGKQAGLTGDIMSDQHNNKPQTSDPLHGQSLEKILLALVDRYGWEELGRRIDIKCFNIDPSIKSSLTFLRKTPWARSKVEELFVNMSDD